MEACRPKSEVDNIIHVVEKWQKGTLICDMEGGQEKVDLLEFRHKHKNRNKYVHQYHVEEIWAPGDPYPLKVLKRYEEIENEENRLLLQPGRIVISRDELLFIIRGIITMAT